MMNKTLPTFLAAMVSLLVGLVSGAVPSEASTARLAFVRGEVRVNGLAARDGYELQEGAIVETGNGKCTVLLGWGNVVHLDHNSRLRVTRHLMQAGKSEDTEVELEYGKTRALIQSRPKARFRKRFHIKAKQVTMGVRGTHIYVEAPRGQDSATFLTVEGRADVIVPRSAELGSRMRPSAGVSRGETAGGTEKSVTIGLASNESVTIGGDGASKGLAPVKLDPAVVARLVESVSPPPRVMRTKADVKSYQDKESDAFQNAGPAPSAEIVVPIVKSPVPFDPSLDGGLPVPVNVNVTVRKL